MTKKGFFVASQGLAFNTEVFMRKFVLVAVSCFAVCAAYADEEEVVVTEEVSVQAENPSANFNCDCHKGKGKGK
ncbi:MAG TPA: hypothetical protein VLE89_00470 [Chlamydiales bacterium]|nr:hypothetical protein [Chlamydiales bacterium]